MGKIQITKKVLGICATNCYTVVDTETKEALIIDPADRADVLIRDWKDKGVTPTTVLLTHGHFDHIGALAGVKKEYPDIKVYATQFYADALSLGSARSGTKFATKDAAH